MEGARKNSERFPIDFELWAVSLQALGDAISCLSVCGQHERIFNDGTEIATYCRVIPLHTDQILIEGESLRAQGEDKKE